MPATVEQQLMDAFSTAWNGAAPIQLGCPTETSLVAVREILDQELSELIAMATAWPSAFIVNCSGNLSGVMICLFKTGDVRELEGLVNSPQDNSPLPGCRKILDLIFTTIARQLNGQVSLNFSNSLPLELKNEPASLKTILGGNAWVGTFSLSISLDITSQLLLFYAPQGAFKTESEMRPQPTMSNRAMPLNIPPAPVVASEPKPRNIDRLLDMELDVVVRFGVTSMALADIVRMGMGSMIELNRAVDEPVELLVNGRSLARCEVVVIDGYYGVRILEIISQNQRVAQAS